MMSQIEIPKKKLNYFYVLNMNKKEYAEVKYLNQHELSEGWRQIIPNNSNKKFINHFSVTLAFLPEQFWKKIYKTNTNDSYKIINNGVTKYTIIETNQDNIMINLFNELSLFSPNKDLLKKYIDNIDTSQYSSWLILRAKYYMNHDIKYNHNIIDTIIFRTLL